MSKLVEFMEFVSKNENARKELDALGSEMLQTNTDALVKFAAKYGFTLTADDLKPTKKEELSEDELEAVAGGKWCGMTSFSCGFPVWIEML